MHKRTLLIDATGLVFRAYYSITPMTAPDDTPVNAVFGLTRILMKVFRDLPVEASAIVFDAGAKTFRNEMFSDYKAHRPAPPDDLRPQFALAIELAKATGAPVFSEVGFEADDIIATLAQQLAEQGKPVTILTSDKDILQLLSPQVELLMPAKRGEFTHHTVAGFEESYGFPINRFVDFKALMGDPSDNIPGVPGVGEKTAAKLVTTFGKLEQIYGNIDMVKPDGLRKKLTPEKDNVFLYRDLVTLRTDAPAEYETAGRVLPDFASEELHNMLAGWGFNRIREDALRLGDMQA